MNIFFLNRGYNVGGTWSKDYVIKDLVQLTNCDEILVC